MKWWNGNWEVSEREKVVAAGIGGGEWKHSMCVIRKV